ncbi:hypothetical protein Cgig2_017831 [Carnegiea gigantea]|uniref:Uncharacterized protein n=1 Tax=Carnegiea gigantea TaxID=171969 RepID=A0A9Q1QT79_9CARY|nr:hypothetical protein Cgig2_017831 [Carnegiea gigantea]
MTDTVDKPNSPTERHLSPRLVHRSEETTKGDLKKQRTIGERDGRRLLETQSPADLRWTSDDHSGHPKLHQPPRTNTWRVKGLGFMGVHGKTVLKKDIIESVQRFNIQINNLTQLKKVAGMKLSLVSKPESNDISTVEGFLSPPGDQQQRDQQLGTEIGIGSSSQLQFVLGFSDPGKHLVGTKDPIYLLLITVIVKLIWLRSHQAQNQRLF